MLAFSLTWFMGIDEESPEQVSVAADMSQVKSGLSTKQTLYAPMTGEMLFLSEVPDETFSSKLLGEGFAILPSEGVVYAPLMVKSSLSFQPSMLLP